MFENLRAVNWEHNRSLCCWFSADHNFVLTVQICKGKSLNTSAVTERLLFLKCDLPLMCSQPLNINNYAQCLCARECLFAATATLRS